MASRKKHINISAVIVTYNPEYKTLTKLINVASKQVSTVIVVDNSSSKLVINCLHKLLPINGIIIDKGFNSGVAEALNTGISEANKISSSYVILFDQDSIPEEHMIEELMREITSGVNVAAVGPKYFDTKGEHASPFVKLNGYSLKRISCNYHDVVKVDHLISSGCLISMEALNNIGSMEEQLFIDYVDTEWCLRAMHKGYFLLGVGSAHMQHDLGDGVVHLFGRILTVHSPLRYYYLIRNGIWLLRQPWISNQWRIMDARRLFIIYIINSFFVGKKFENWKMMTQGIWDGLNGKMGSYKNR